MRIVFKVTTANGRSIQAYQYGPYSVDYKIGKKVMGAMVHGRRTPLFAYSNLEDARAHAAEFFDLRIFKCVATRPHRGVPRRGLCIDEGPDQTTTWNRFWENPNTADSAPYPPGTVLCGSIFPVEEVK